MRHLIFPILAALSFCIIAPACAINGTEPGAVTPYEAPPAPTPYVPPAPVKTTRKVVILHTNDEHSHLLGYGSYADYPWVPEADGKVTKPGDPGVNPGESTVEKVLGKLLAGSDQQTVGGAVRRQYLINKIREEATDPVLVLSAGDLTMGTIFHPALPVGAPDFVAMTLMGYDFATLGNHEFDFGSDALAAGIHALDNTTFGGGLKLVSTNAHFDDVTTGPGAALKALYGDGGSEAPVVPWATKTLANGLKVGFIGMLGFEAALVAPAASPIYFSLPTSGAACTSTPACGSGKQCLHGHCVDPARDQMAIIGALAADIQPTVTMLKDVENCDLVIALSHSGSTEDAGIAMATSGIDVIIGGHTHEEIPPTVINSLIAGKSIMVQAGWYGRRLGQLTLTVDPDGVVAVVADQSTLQTVNYTLDAQMLAGSNPTATPPVFSKPFERALGLTQGVLGPVVAGMNAALAPAFPEISPFNVIAPLALTSDHDIVGETLSTDSALEHLVTDADLLSVLSSACLGTHLTVPVNYFVAIQANGVLRESLRFSKGASQATTFADVFSVAPLGASPFATTSPGYPLVMLQLDAPSLFAGLDVGVTTGLVSDSFFLSYAGMRVTFDKSFAPLNPAVLMTPCDTWDGIQSDCEAHTDCSWVSAASVCAHIGPTGPTGRIMSIDMNTTPNGAPTWVNVYTYTAAVPFFLRWSNIDLAGGEKIMVISNMYLAGFLDSFGLTPYHPYTGAALTPIAPFGALDVVGQTILCMDMTATCGPLPLIRPCLSSPANIGTDMVNGQWAPTLIEVKEWAILAKYLLNPTGINGAIPATFYKSPLTTDWTTPDVTDPMATNMVRVKDVTP
ncbi:MAG: metallophosphoesterase [Deltaproteobacteria bacterium]|nr:metallophosphoesterase [Deltaproteobacteria bacterium]